jgi:hypothetical protein
MELKFMLFMSKLFEALNKDFGKHGAKNVCTVTYTVRASVRTDMLMFVYSTHSTCENSRTCYHDSKCGLVMPSFAPTPYTFEDCI